MAQNKIKSNRDWHYKKIEKIAIFERGREPGSASYNRNMIGIRFIRVVDMSKSRTDILYTNRSLEGLKLCKTGDILIVLDGSPGIVRKDLMGAYSSGIRKVVLKSTDINYNFLYFILKSNIVQDKIAEYSQGITIKHASSALKHIDVPIPSLEEQNRIVYILSTIERAIDLQEKIVVVVKLLKKAMMRKLFIEGIGHKEFKETALEKLPSDWTEEKISDHCKILTGGTPDTKVKEYWQPKEIPWMRSGDIQGKPIYSVKTYISDIGLKNSNAKLLPKKSVVIALAGQGKTRGTCAPLEFECSCNQSVVCLVPDKEVNYMYLYYYLTKLYTYIRNMTGDKDRGGLNKVLIGNIPLFLPKLDKQERIVSILFKLDEKLFLNETQRFILKQIFGILLNKLINNGIKIDNLEVSDNVNRQ
jgi:type I restriction enzyme S subunit